MKIALAAVLPLLLLLIFSPASMSSSALAPSGPDGHGPGVYIVFVSRADYVDSVDYDLRLLASVAGSKAEAKAALLYHYSSIGFAARLAPEHAHQLSKKDGVAVIKDKTVRIQEDGGLPGFFKENNV
ncbi:uncharacterized protein LOC8062121 isoform X1 [Sorghum bicolor]|uniref:Inhibitor I9 domain-containing protein n=1 Tax=Sorghum bicolor TaxID=4558 RepID=A0A1B6Q5W1_SORBI|nr:uncharacterized protein LOC8062121 isoform X1 [Sorghum bicolor]KXG33303.1 hypothetical protein SORBI_3003G284400 [Sorghum bicolor]|eukprot:XP_021311205.1 uncharacterized protein LOC8062121 isoform X1 [Sorghum bicolor]